MSEWRKRLKLEAPPWPWVADAHAWDAIAGHRRAKAKFKTGSVTTAAAVAIREVATWAQAKIAIEVGTFIGNSTMALKAVAEHVHTCDFSNDCLEPHTGITTYPYQTSLSMFTQLRDRRVVGNFCFFDGRLSEKDADILPKVTTYDCVFLFDDYEGRQKGVKNVELLAPRLPGYSFIVLDELNTTLAMLVPSSRL